jgi:hypothetical protein
LTDETQGGSRSFDNRGNQPPPAPSADEIDAVVAFSPLMARLDVAVAAFLALLAATIAAAMPLLIASGGIEVEHDFSTLSPALIPRMAFVVLSGLSLVALFTAVQTLRAGAGQPKENELQGMQRAAIAMIIAIAYASSVTWLGYILATMLMTAAMSWFLGLRNPLGFVPGVVIVPVVIRFVFERLLLIALPRSEIESIGVIEDALMRVLTRTFLS